jgi:hypothetical protein
MIVEDKSSAPTLASLGGDDKRPVAHEGHTGAFRIGPDPLPDPYPILIRSLGGAGG